MNSLTISQLARRSGVPASTLRYYEKVGVLPRAHRSESGYRLYGEDALARCRRRARGARAHRARAVNELPKRELALAVAACAICSLR